MIKTKNQIIPCIYERCFAYVFDYDINNLEYLIASILDININLIKGNIKRISPKIDLKNKEDKKKELNFIYKIDKLKINIELNLKPKISKIRNINYLTAIHFNEIKKGDNYNSDYKTIQININNENVIDNEDIIEEYCFRNKKGNIYTDNVKFLTISLPKLKKICYNDNEILDKYKYLLPFFINDTNIYKKYKGDIRMENISKRQMEFSEDSSEYVSYRDENEKEKMYNTGLSMAKEEGIKERNIQIAKNMIDKNIDRETIMEVTGLNKEELDKI